ncbi:GspH/FimT family pseudopilin [Pseudomonas akapageensis]|uniref:GspH/FimT family pseudopilin n=1 Tax=Pseudomonas akapageensis TaxID=2609961 RepID=UPI00140A34B7|nr:GspH/FimT family protein [Pseudomonas akapageensis]
MRQQGMTLIQLLAVMALVTVLVQLATPTFADMTARQHRQLAAEQLAIGLRTARSEAILRHQPVVIHAVEQDWSKGWRITADASGQGHDDSDNPLLIERRESGRVTVVGNQPVRNFVRFSELGAPLHASGAFQAGTLHICQGNDPKSHYQVVLAKSGRVSLRQGLDEQALCERQGLDEQALCERQGS